MRDGRASGLLERIVQHRAMRAGALAFAVWLGLMFFVRGVRVAPAPPERLAELIANLVTGSPIILSQADIERVAAVASALTAAEGRRPGPFHVLYLERLDPLEKFHHLMHQPFTGIRTMYCDVWIHSVTTYGRPEPTWGFGRVLVRPALKLPILLFLMDRLEREQSAAGEYAGAVFEAFAGMDMHRLPGRARLWERIFGAAETRPVLADWVAEQLRMQDPAWTDAAEVGFWRARGPDPAAAFREELARRRPPPPAAPVGR